jgi:hypothetical protein
MEGIIDQERDFARSSFPQRSHRKCRMGIRGTVAIIAIANCQRFRGITSASSESEAICQTRNSPMK